METLISDLRYTLRNFRRSPGFVAVALISLGLGIGANSAIFSLYSAVFLRSLPVESPDRLVNIYTADETLEHATFSYPDFVDLREQTGDVFEDVLVFSVSLLIHQEGAESRYLFGESVSGNYWRMLGIRPEIGRPFDPLVDDEPGAAPVVILGHTLWRTRFGADPDILGRTIQLNGKEVAVVGVGPKPFRGLFPIRNDFWVTFSTQSQLTGFRDNRAENRSSRDLWVKGRLAEGVSVEQAASAVEAVSARLTETYPETNTGARMSVLRTEDVALLPVVDRPIRLVGYFLMVVVGLGLLIACTNLAGMLLARASARRREIAVRLALGAGRGRLIRQLLVESLTISILGGLVGLAVAGVLVQLMVAFQPPIPIPINLDIRLDGMVVLFTFLVSLATGVFFGLVPALQSTRPAVTEGLRHADGARGRLHRLRLRSGLVVAQVAISAVLLVCSGLFLRSLSNAGSIDPGFDAREGIALSLELVMHEVGQEEVRGFYGDLKQRVEALPGVESVAMVEHLPMGASIQSRGVIPETHVLLPEEGEVEVDCVSAGAGYFKTMGVPLLAGREFSGQDLPGGPEVAIVNEAFARRFWPGEDPIGKRLKLGEDMPWIEVVGVAATGKYRTLGEEPRPFFWLNADQQDTLFFTVVARTSVPAAPLLPVMRDLVHEIDPDLPIFELKTIREHMQLMLFLPRLFAILLSGMGALALFLGIVGLYGVMSFDVARRRREIGIRMSLGAHPSDVIRWVVGGGVRMVAVGLVVGFLVAAAVTGSLSSLLYGVSPLDPITFIGIALLLLGVAWAATWGPARRAASVDPTVALRQE